MIKTKNLETIRCTGENLCGTCQEAKMTRKPFPKSNPHESEAVLDFQHTDLCGPMRTQTPINIFSLSKIFHASHSQKLKNKSKVKKQNKGIYSIDENTERNKTKSIHSDRGGKYINDDLKNYYKKEGIKMKLTPGYTPQLNGLAERKSLAVI